MATDSVIVGEGSPGAELRHPYTGGAVGLAPSAGKDPAFGTIAPADEEDDCVICMDKPGAFRGQLSSCDHVFCFECIKKWSETENTCPLCKKRFTKIDKVAANAAAAAAPVGKGKGKRKRTAGGAGEDSVKVKRRSQSQSQGDGSGAGLAHIAALLGPILGLGSDDGSPFMDLEYLMRSANRASVIQAALARNRTQLAARLREQQQQARQEEDALYSHRNRPGESGFSEDNPEVIADSDDEVQIVDAPAGSSSSSNSSSSSSSSSSTSSQRAAPPLSGAGPEFAAAAHAAAAFSAFDPFRMLHDAFAGSDAGDSDYGGSDDAW